MRVQQRVAPEAPKTIAQLAGYAESDGPTVRTIEIPSRLGDVDYALTELQQLLDVFGQRLQPVLGPLLPSAEEASQSEEDLTDIGRSLRVFAYRTRSIHHQIQSLLGRLEI